MSKICPLCNNKETILLTNKLRFNQNADILKCANCTLVYLDQDSCSFPKDFYESKYHQSYLTHIDPDILDPKKYYKKMQESSNIWINKIRKILTGNEIVLDMGCSTGHLITGIKDLSHEIYGHELSRKEVEFCKNELKIDVDNIPLEERFSEKSFDIITLIFVLEHIGQPIEFLTELKKYLKDNGKLIILVPNILDPLINLYNIEKFQEFYFCIEHLYYYSPATLEKTLHAAGYNCKLNAIQEYPITNHLNWIYCQKPREALSARKNIPDVELINDNLKSEFTNLWESINNQYSNFLTNNNLSDRVWCVAEPQR